MSDDLPAAPLPDAYALQQNINASGRRECARAPGDRAPQRLSTRLASRTARYRSRRFPPAG
ncbi:hypothetical protein XHV734_1426 [Xanthomonas hortorum pv. vitians]|nr:hypothetical protein XHV734_1426 [Xanthomonas hortorum pv. vitians]